MSCGNPHGRIEEIRKLKEFELKEKITGSKKKICALFLIKVFFKKYLKEFCIRAIFRATTFFSGEIQGQYCHSTFYKRNKATRIIKFWNISRIGRKTLAKSSLEIYTWHTKISSGLYMNMYVIHSRFQNPAIILNSLIHFYRRC